MGILSRVCIGAAVAILLGGLIYDGMTEGEEPNLAPLYGIGVALGVLAMGLGAVHRRRSGHR